MKNNLKLINKLYRIIGELLGVIYSLNIYINDEEIKNELKLLINDTNMVLDEILEESDE